jgi:hypothetical protein
MLIGRPFVAYLQGWLEHAMGAAVQPRNDRVADA